MSEENAAVTENSEKTATPYKVGPGHPPLEAQWKPGQSGNPNGRPKGNIVDELLKALHEELDTEKGKVKIGRAVAQKLLQAALKGDLRATNQILDFTESKPKQSVEHSGPDGQPIAVSVVDLLTKRDEEK